MDPWVAMEMFENITNSRSANCTRYSSCNAEISNTKSGVDIINCNIPISDTDCYQQSSISDSYKQQSLNIEIRIFMGYVTLFYHQENNGIQNLTESEFCSDLKTVLSDEECMNYLESILSNDKNLIYPENITVNVSFSEMQVYISFNNSYLIISTDTALFNCIRKS